MTAGIDMRVGDVRAGDAYDRLAAEHEALMQFLYLAPVGLVQTAADGEILMINPVSAQLLMPLQQDGNLVNLFDALAGVAPELRHLCAAFARPRGMVCDGLHIHVDGRTPQVLSLTLLKLDGTRLMAVLADVTQQVRRDRQLRQNEAWLGALLTSITDYALVGLDGAGRVSAWNETIARVTGHGEDVVGQPYSVFYPQGATTSDHTHDRLREADQNGWSLDEGPRVRADGSEFWASAMISPLPDRDADVAEPGEAAYCLVLRDVSDKREALDARRKSLFCDHLTGVANRRAFFEAAELELDRNRRAPRPTALVLLDADHFKRINDRHGHAGGDAVLRHLGQLLAATFRQVDVVARVGGEEFAVLLPSTGLDAAVAVAERLRGLVAGRPVAYDGAHIACTVSAGVAVCDGEAPGLDGLMKRADQALYAAKAAGRDRVERWHPALASEARR
ncbi:MULTISPECIES: sensor domain-containing diguanylate cyclase [unclassified Massilia]|uniref:sensor domain-containing diguanylate cyclase n=1 Tax=unclassified Massilia TaxID=2609279 RepID=UPI000AAAAC2A|nr:MULTISPECIES: sensor domain-containing diguanylate cyclase [unclassified Massilia]